MVIADHLQPSRMARNVALYPWFRFGQNLVFWQAVWFLYFQNSLSAAEAILLYAVYDVAATVLEVPSGYMSDRLGRRITLILASVAGLVGTAVLAAGSGFAAFALAQCLLGAQAAFASGTDSAFLYESLAAQNRQDEVERQEVRAWRFSFLALALSAVAGGAMSLVWPGLPFLASALAFATLVFIAVNLREPPRNSVHFPQGAEILRLGTVTAAFRNPVLVWLFCLSVLMYIYSHIPFVFGQPFILEALRNTGFEADAPLVSGAVTTVMMALSLIVSLIALPLRRRLGLAALLLVAFGLQIALSAVLAATGSVIAIAFLFLRMVPDALSKPFILARVQPLLGDDSRATYLSLQSFLGRLIFAASLFFASMGSSDQGSMVQAEIRTILGWYVVVGVACLVALALVSHRVRVGDDDR